MQADKWFSFLGLVFGVCGTVAGIVGSIKAVPIVPAYAAKVREIGEILQRVIDPQMQLGRFLLTEIKKLEPMEAALSSAEFMERLAILVEQLQKAEILSRPQKLLDFDEDSTRAANAAGWLLASVVLMTVSAFFQGAVLWSGTPIAPVVRDEAETPAVLPRTAVADGGGRRDADGGQGQ
jgi:hypothetical protein